MAAEDDQSGSTPLAPKSSPGEQAASSAPESSEIPTLSVTEYWNLIQKTRVIDKDIAARVADKPFQSGNPKVWGVLTALSNRARKRKQGLNMFLKDNVHFMGGLVEDYQFQIDSPFVSREHCKIYRQTFTSEDDALKSQPLVFLKDISYNGTYVNGIRYTRRDKAVQIHHGDMISFVKPLCHDISFTFMYREVLKSDVSSNGVLGKRKPPAEEVGCEVGISVDDFRSLQRSNAELRKKLEDRGVTMDKLQNENGASMLHHHHQTVSQKRGGLSETTTEIMDNSNMWGEAEAANCFVGVLNDDDDEEQQLFKPPLSEKEEESMGSCPPGSEKEEDDEEEEDWCRLDSNTRKVNYNDSDSEESGEEVVSEFCNFKTERRNKKMSDDARKFGFDSDGLLIIDELELKSKSAVIKEEFLVKQEDEVEEEESMGSSPNSSLPSVTSSSSSSSSSKTTYIGLTAAAAALNLSSKKKKRKKNRMMSSVTSSHSLHSYFAGLTTEEEEEDSKKKKKKMKMMTISSVMTPPSVQCCYYGLPMNLRKKKKKSISSVTTFQSVDSSSSSHDDSYVESGEEVVSPDRLRRIGGKISKQMNEIDFPPPN